MKICAMTFNTQHCLNYISREIDFDLMADTIKACAPDIVALNEMRNVGNNDDYRDQVGILAQKTGMHGYFAEAIRFDDEANPYGNGLLSRFPILSTEIYKIPAPKERKYNNWYEDRCLLKARLKTDSGVLCVMVIHVGLNPDEAELAIDTILAHLEGERCILMGDFNLKPDSPFIQKIAQRMQDAAALIEGEAYSFPSDKPRVKIDYIFASPDIKIESACIPSIVASDHRPHTAVLDI